MRLLLLLTLLFIAGCQSAPTRDNQAEASPRDVAAFANASYLGRFMLPDKENTKLYLGAHQAYAKQSADQAMDGMATPQAIGGVVATAVHGTPFGVTASNTASGVAAGLMLAELLLGDHSSGQGKPVVGKIYLPAEGLGKDIETEAQAHAAAMGYTMARLKEFAAAERRTMACIALCDHQSVARPDRR